MGWLVTDEDGDKPVDVRPAASNVHFQESDRDDGAGLRGVDDAGRPVRFPCNGPCGGFPEGECAWVIWREVFGGDGSGGPVRETASTCPVQRAWLVSRGHGPVVE